MTMSTDAEFVQANPLSAVSASMFPFLAPEEQKMLIGQLIDGAVYCDSWEAYFNYALNNGICINDDVAFEAAQAVGLDPVSTDLWIVAACCCTEDEARRELFQLALSIPLYNRSALVEEYQAFEETLDPSFRFTDTHEASATAVMRTENWPDRYEDVSVPEARREVRQQWVVLMEVMTRNLKADIIPAELQMRRMELAYRQMCVQFPTDDSCWYELALFQLSVMEDKEAATESLEAGLQACGGSSFSLSSLMGMVTGKRTIDGQEQQQQQQLVPSLAVVDERLEANKYAIAAAAAKKSALKELRNVGKRAANEGVHDWKVYSQWHSIEHSLVKDQRMAAKVLEQGMICCSTSPDSAALLGNEAIKYHITQRHEREALGYAEQQVEQASQTHHTGRKRAAWNTLVATENQLGLSFSKVESRRGEEFPQSRMHSFLQRCRVGNYLPCTPETMAWLQFVDDYTQEKRAEKEAPFKDVEPVRHTTLCPPLALAHLAMPAEPARVHETSWVPFVCPPNRFAAAAATAKPGTEDPDEVVGSRELRGRWAYRVKLDKQTVARLNREERLRKARATDEDGPGGVRANTAMGVLAQKTKALSLHEGQARRLTSVSVDWIINQLVSSELDLHKVLQDRAATQSQ